MILKQQKKYGFPDMITMSFQTSIFYSLLFAVKRVIDALLPTLSIFITADFLNTAIAVYNKQAEISAAYRPVALLVGIMLYNTLSWIIMNIVDCRRQIRYREKLRQEMYRNIALLEFRHIENPKIVDLLNRISWSFEWETWGMYNQVLNVVNLVVYVAGIIITLYTQVWWIAVSMLAASVPILYIATRAGKRSYDADREMTKIDRRTNYLSSVMNSREAVDERTMYGTTEHLNKQYTEKYEYARKFRLKVSRNNFIKSKSGGIVTTAYSVGAMLALLPPVVEGSMSIGMFIALLGAVFGLANRLSWGVNWMVEDISRKREFLRDITEFMSLERCEGATDLPKQGMDFKKIEFKDVCFRYPGTEKIILDGVSFVIENGKHYSFVGENGAGKTTITKLITGLYTNYEGEISVDGRSLREYSQAELKGLTSVVYQDFAAYGISMRENIALGNTNDMENNKAIEDAVELIGLKEAAEKLRDGLDTPLGKNIENGVDISGGEWQRVAMARSVMSGAPLKILDEPTASLDPIGESMVYNNFEQISKGMTTIFISHRLGSTKLADIIYVLDGGKIVESGSHNGLMENKGLYAEMFAAQAEWYRNDTEMAEEAGN